MASAHNQREKHEHLLQLSCLLLTSYFKIGEFGAHAPTELVSSVFVPNPNDSLYVILKSNEWTMDSFYSGCILIVAIK